MTGTSSDNGYAQFCHFSTTHSAFISPQTRLFKVASCSKAAGDKCTVVKFRDIACLNHPYVI